MVNALVADTHAVVWYLADRSRLGPTALAAMQQAVAAGEPVRVSSVTFCELQYLVEKGRIPASVLASLFAEVRRPGSMFEVVAFGLDAAEAVGRVNRNEVPDMPDRMIAATALHLGLPLVTKDHRIRASGVVTIW